MLSDGIPEPSPKHAAPKYELSKIVSDIRAMQSQHLICIGLGKSTGHVKQYYPNGLVVPEASDLTKHLTGLLKDIVDDANQFSI